MCNLEHCRIESHKVVTCLAQVHISRLYILDLSGNQFEAGPMACLSGGRWPRHTCTRVALSFQNLDACDGSLLGVFCKDADHEANKKLFHCYPTKERAVFLKYFLVSICRHDCLWACLHCMILAEISAT